MGRRREGCGAQIKITKSFFLPEVLETRERDSPAYHYDFFNGLQVRRKKKECKKKQDGRDDETNEFVLTLKAKKKYFN